MAIFFPKIFWFFRHIFFSFMVFSLSSASATAIWVINLSFLGSFYIRTDLKFWPPVNPGSLPRGTKMLTTRFLKTFRSIWPITQDTVKIGKNEFDIHDKHWKLHLPTNFESILSELNFLSIFTQISDRKIVILATFFKLTQNL